MSGQPRRWFNLQWIHDLFLQRLLRDGDEETQGVRCGETAAPRAGDTLCHVVFGYFTGDTRKLPKEVVHPGGGTRLHWPFAWRIILRSTGLCLSHLGHLFHYSHSCFCTHASKSHLIFLDAVFSNSLNVCCSKCEYHVSTSPRFRLTFLVLLPHYAYAVSSLMVSLKGVCMVNRPCLFWERPWVCSLLYIMLVKCSLFV